MASKKNFEELVSKQADSFVKKIVSEVVTKKAVDVHFEEEDDQRWAIVKVHNDEEEQELGIRLQSGEKWVLQFGYYDDDDEFIELLQPLVEAEVALIPPVLQKVLRKVLASEEGLRVPGNFLLK